MQFLKSFDHVTEATSPEVVERITVRFEHTNPNRVITLADMALAASILMEDAAAFEPPIPRIDSSELIVETEGNTGNVSYVRRGIRTSLIPSDYIVVGWCHELPMQRKSA